MSPRMLRIAVVCDLLEEAWSSMDLVALMLEQCLNAVDGNEVTRLCPPMRRRFSQSNGAASKHKLNVDRVLNRFWTYPRWLRARREQFDVFHVVDHSYAQLVHELPSERTVVTCHDLDTFRCILDPPQERRSLPIRVMAKRTLEGLQKAAWITCASASTRDALVATKLVSTERVSVVPNGVHPNCSSEPDPLSDGEAERLLGPPRAHDLLHVGTTIPRKRIDVLLRVLACVRQQFPQARLIRAGGPFTSEQTALADRLNVSDAVVVLPRLEWNILAAVYRRASLVLMPSEREGFGLPVAESMACGTPVVASDLPVLREVGGPAAEYCAVGDIEAWSETVVRLLKERTGNEGMWQNRRESGIRRAAEFTWTKYACRMARIYSELLAA
jgi:glycosyltransferase involved in cell wall biosynthesis